MGSLVFRLRNVPDDEAQAVRSLLDDNQIDWYETTAGNWGIAMPGLWVSNENDIKLARALIEKYQEERQRSLRRAYEDGLTTGETRTFIQAVKDSPLKTLATIAFCLFVLYVSVNPFLQLIGLSKQ